MWNGIIFLLFGSIFICCSPVIWLLCRLCSVFKQPKSLNGKVVLVTGAAGCLGTELCKQLSLLGCKLICVDIAKDSLDALVAVLGDSAVGITCDISDWEDVKKLKSQVKHVDILVNNAAILNFELSSVSQLIGLIKKQINVNLVGQYWMIRAFLPLMLQQNSGHIVAVSSAVSKFPIQCITTYALTKAAVNALMDSLDSTLITLNKPEIKCTTVMPGILDTPSSYDIFYPSGILPPYPVKETAEEIIQGLQKEKKIIYIPWYIEVIIMAARVYPRWLTKYYTPKILGQVRIPPNELIDMESYFSSEDFQFWINDNNNKYMYMLQTFLAQEN